MKSLRFAIAVLALTCVTSILTGCGIGTAFGDRMISPIPMVAERLGDVSRGTDVRVWDFVDQRADRDFGCVRNGFMSKTARVVSTTSADAWVRDSLGESLRRSGANVVHGVDNENVWELSGRVMGLYCDMSHAGLIPSIEVVVVLRRNGRTVFDRTFRSAVGTQPALYGTPQEYQAALDVAMRSMLNDAVPEICRAMQG